MTVALKSAMRYAGFNPTRYGFHSFRSGFLTSVLLVAKAKGSSFHDTMTMAALITGWTAFGAIQFNYFKQPARRNIVTTNMIGITDTPTHTRKITFEPPKSLANKTETGDYILQSSLDFHHLESITPVQHHRSFGFEVKRLLAEKLRIPSASLLSNYNYITSSYGWCLKEFARREMMEEQKSLETVMDIYGSYNSLRKKGLEIVDRRLESNPDSAPIIAEEMYTMLREEGKLKCKLRSDYYRTPYICKGPPRPMMKTRSDRPRRERREWAEEEEAIFEAGLIRNKTAREIADDLFIRTPEDVRLHLRAENKRRAEHKPPYPPLAFGKAKRGTRGRPKFHRPPVLPVVEVDDGNAGSDSESTSNLSNESFGILESQTEEKDEATTSDESGSDV